MKFDGKDFEMESWIRMKTSDTEELKMLLCDMYLGYARVQNYMIKDGSILIERILHIVFNQVRHDITIRIDPRGAIPEAEMEFQKVIPTEEIFKRLHLNEKSWRKSFEYQVGVREIMPESDKVQN